jgi:hypothetical protein
VEDREVRENLIFEMSEPDKYNGNLEILQSKAADLSRAVDGQVIKSIHDICKTRGALFGRDIKLSDVDIREIEKLFDAADAICEIYIQENKPLWDELMRLHDKLNDMGILDFPNYFRSNDDTKVIKKIRVGEKKLPGLEMPTFLHNLYEWKRKIKNTRDLLKFYKSGNLYGTSASNILDFLKPLYVGLVKNYKEKI